MKKRLFFASIAAAVLFAPATNAQVLEDVPRHRDIFSFDDLVAAINADAVKLYDLRVMGLSVFAVPFNNHDGLGDGPFDINEWLIDPIAFGHRPTLQGNGTFLRVNGLDAQSCNECHTIESNRTDPPRLGVAGVGGAVQNAIIMASLIDVADSSDDRVSYVAGHDPDLPLVPDGVADYSGRFSNPPFLYGGGGVELLAKEMTVDLQSALAQARAGAAGDVTYLDTHGVNFGYIVSLGGGAVDLSNVEGIGPAHIAGLVDPHEQEQALVVRPFGRKGENFSMRDFDRGAMQFHFGIQPVEVVGAGMDEDGDGVVDEVTEAEMSVLHIFDTTNARPRMETLDATAQAGFANFTAVGCVQCHMPMLETYDTLLPLAHPEVATDPSAYVYTHIDLTKDLGSNSGDNFLLSQTGNGVVVPLFSDLKRHYMGPGLAETFERGELANGEFITARLWGIADTGPYLHDGRATTLHQAIMQHGGEAEPVRLAYEALDVAQQSELISFLLKLKVPEGANADLAKTLIKQ